MNIPNIIHRTHTQINEKSANNFNADTETQIDTRINNWSSKITDTFIRKNYGWIINVYDILDEEKRTEVAICLYMYHFGGIYNSHKSGIADSDINDILKNKTNNIIISSFNSKLQNMFIASIPKSSFWYNILCDIMKLGQKKYDMNLSARISRTFDKDPINVMRIYNIGIANTKKNIKAK